VIPLPPLVAGAPFDVETAAGRVTAYELGEGRTVLVLHSFNAARNQGNQATTSSGSARLGSATRTVPIKSLV
jgi:hypothetical protein